MRNIIAIALGLLLLVSAAAATGNNNGAKVDVNSEVSGMDITDANVAQVTNLNANIFGNDICADQKVDIQIEDSCLTGTAGKDGCSDGKTSATQCVDLMLNSTGCDNHDSQYVEFAQGCNDITKGNLSQFAAETLNDVGSCNKIDQSSSAFAGVWEHGDCVLGSPNCLTNSDLKQVQVLAACVTGDKNQVCQDDNQFATDNSLTNSKLFEQVALVSNTLGCDNEVDQQAVQEAEKNCLTGSLANKIICENSQVTGSKNDVDQFASTENECNKLTLSTELQKIDETARVLGCNNDVEQCVDLQNKDNCATGGHIVQESVVKTDV